MELDWCDKCGTTIPADYLRERNGLMLCPECYNENKKGIDPEHLELTGWQANYLFEEMAERFNPINDPFYDHFHIDDDY